MALIIVTFVLFHIVYTRRLSNYLLFVLHYLIITIGLIIVHYATLNSIQFDYYYYFNWLFSLMYTYTFLLPHSIHILLILLLTYFQFSGITPAVATKIVTALSIGRKWQGHTLLLPSTDNLPLSFAVKIRSCSYAFLSVLHLHHFYHLSSLPLQPSYIRISLPSSLLSFLLPAFLPSFPASFNHVHTPLSNLTHTCTYPRGYPSWGPDTLPGGSTESDPKGRKTNQAPFCHMSQSRRLVRLGVNVELYIGLLCCDVLCCVASCCILIYYNLHSFAEISNNLNNACKIRFFKEFDV